LKLIHCYKELISIDSLPSFLEIHPSSDIEPSAHIETKDHFLEKADYVSEDKIYFNKKGISLNCITNKNLIEVFPKNNVDKETLLYHTLQIPMGCLFAQREKIVLHASAIEKEGKSLIFVGNPGMGKSTLVLKLVENGWNFITEDICVIDKAGSFSCRTSFPIIKLSDEASQSHESILEKTIVKKDALLRSTYKLKMDLSKTNKLVGIFFLDWGSDLKVYEPNESTSLRLLLNYLIPSFQTKAHNNQLRIYEDLTLLNESIKSRILERPKIINQETFNKTIDLINTYI
tara:strand:+ start:13 stop:876 length:864 start_codon:yes stop_codon:yes gene_type:complete